VVNLILLISLTIFSAIFGFCLVYFLVLNKNKKNIAEQTTFDRDQAINIFMAYKHKKPNEQQIKAMISAYKKNKIN
jgi:uncharacterized protein YneF (UPF0154 family)